MKGLVNIYLLVLTCFAGASGRLGDILGIRALLNVGLMIFGPASALGGLAESGYALLLARAVLGIGAAMIFPLSLVVLIWSFEEKERGLALGSSVFAITGSFPTVFAFVAGFAACVLIFTYMSLDRNKASARASE